MGHASSVAVDKSQELINKKIDRVIAEDKKKDSKIIKLLLLGEWCDYALILINFFFLIYIRGV